MPAPGARRGAPAAFSHPSPLTPFVRRDLIWAAATAVASAVLFATVLSGHTALGDAPESIAGVSSLGILHDPGYPTYVVSAHVFTLLVPFGSEAFRVSLFSLLCAGLSIGGVQLLARRFGVPRWAASIGALTLAASSGFWYYAVFAKHDTFSGLLFLITLHLAIGWLARPSTRRLVGLAVAIAWGLGSSWPLEVLVLPAVGAALLIGRRRLALPSLALATGTGLALIVAIGGFVMVRASANPPINWGGATNVSRLIALVKRSDFTTPSSNGSGTAATPQPGTSPGPSGAPAGGVITTAGASNHLSGYAAIFSRELGVLGLLLAFVGLVASLAWRRTPATFPVLIAFLVNLIGATVVVGFGRSDWGLDGDLTTEGFVLGCYFGLACWIGLGAAELAAGISRLPIARLTTRRGADAGGEGGRARLARFRLQPVLATIGVLALGAALVVPLVARSGSAVHRSSQPFADRFAQAVFSELPPHAALFVLGAELSQPLIYRQVVDHQRPDVAVIALDGLSYDWYRAQSSRKLGVAVAPLTPDVFTGSARILRAVARLRPVYLDARAAQQLRGTIGYAPVGLVSQLVAGPSGQAPTESPAALGGRIITAAKQAGFPNADWNVWPNNFLSSSEYSIAALQAAEAQYHGHDLAGMRQTLQEDLQILPGNPPALNDLELLNSGKR